MKQKSLFALAGLIILVSSSAVRANPTPAERVAEIQTALRAAKLDGWLFYDFRGERSAGASHSDAGRRRLRLAPLVLLHSRFGRADEDRALDRALQTRSVARQTAGLPRLGGTTRASARNALGPAEKKKPLRIAMQYSPMNDIPYISRVDAGTIELIRSFGVEPVTSAELVQQFEAVLTPEQKQSHVEASDKMHRILLEAFAEIGRNIRADKPMTEYDIQQFIARRLEEEGMERENGIVAVNANTANPHYFPTREANSPIKRGDFVLLDIVSKLRKPGAICTDQTWTGYVGETVPEEFTRIFNIVREARDAATEFVRKNVREGKSIRGAEVDDVSRGVIKRAGYAEQFTHRTGHSIGEEGHGNGVNIDNFETRDSRRITPGVCFSIEPGIYLEGKFGVRSEIDVYVADKDIEVTGQPIQTEIVAILKPQ